MSNNWPIFFFKQVEIPNHEIMVKEFKNLFPSYDDKGLFADNYFVRISDQDIKKHFIEFLKWSTEKGLVLRTAAFIKYTSTVSNIHIDSAPTTCALNFGLDIPLGSYTRMYKQLTGNIIENLQHNGIPRKVFIDATFQEITKFDLSKPTIFNTQVPHGITTPKDTTRISISFRFHNKDILSII